MKRQSMTSNDILIVGVGLTPVGEHWEKSLRELAQDAISAVLNDAAGLKPQALFVANMMASYLSRQTLLAVLLADFAGLRGIEAVTLEAAGASGGVALRQAYLALSSRMIDIALVVGVEKVTDRASTEIEAAQATASDVDYEAIHGVTPIAQAALLMRRYLYEYNAPAEALAGFSLNAHINAATNPHAIYQRPIKAEDYKHAPMVSEPINLFDAAPLADGAAALLLAREDVLPEYLPHPKVRIAASTNISTIVALHDRLDPLQFTAVTESVRHALQQANLTPDDIDLFELHDRFSIYAALSLEAAGFAERGQGWRLAQDNVISRDGSIPICTFGGSKARGDTGGATGVYQLAETTLQLQGRAGENQVPGARVGMTQCLGGIAAIAVTHILERADGQ